MKHDTYSTITTILDILEVGAKLVAGGILLYMMFQFSEGMSAWVELDRMVNKW